MCSICGIIDYGKKPSRELINKMGLSMKNRGPDASEDFCDDIVALQHNRLAVMDIENGHQPMSATYKGKKYVIVYNGEIYNCPELRRDLCDKGAEFNTNCDTETVLWAYIMYKDKCPEMLNGIFAFTVYDLTEKRLFFARDRLGVKPFFYSLVGNEFSFASEIKALLKNPSVSSKVDMVGLWQLLFLTPVTLQGSSIFKDILELKPGQCGEFSKNGLKIYTYWQIEAKEWSGSAEEATEKTRELLCDAVQRQTVSDVPLCTFLSGGLDSSVLTAVACDVFKEQGNTLSTYSFEYEDNKQNFKQSLFQPQGDDEFAVFLSKYLGTEHTVLIAPNSDVADCLIDATLARDFPGQADIDSSLLYFCKQVKKQHTVAISGECSDEIFGGYPWFYRPEMLYRDFFPWIHEPMERVGIFKESFAKSQDGFDYMSNEYKKIIASVSTLPDDSESMKTSRIATCLSVGFFMTSLLERKDRMSMYSGLEVRVPFADHRILEYVYNIPWEIKFENGVEKALLRNAMSDYLPDKILWRKKSPYPKTHSPEYRKQVTQMLKSRLESNSILNDIIDYNVLESVIIGQDKTWFGQLMSTPQLLAWLIQFDTWVNTYNVDFVD